VADVKVLGFDRGCEEGYNPQKLGGDDMPQITDLLVSIGNLLIAIGIAVLLIRVGGFFERL